MGAIQVVVRAHDRLHVGEANTDLEGEKVGFSSRTIIDDGVCGAATCLLVIEGEVLYYGDHVLSLSCLEMLSCDGPSEERIFALRFKRSSITRFAAGEVDVATEIDVHPVGAQLFSDDFAVFVGQMRIPRGGAGDCGGQRSGRAHHSAHAYASIGDIEIRNIQARYALHP